MAKDIQQLERVHRRAARFVKKDYRHTTSVTGLLEELGLVSALCLLDLILLLLVCVSFTIIGQPRNSVLIRRV